MTQGQGQSQAGMLVVLVSMLLACRLIGLKNISSRQLPNPAHEYIACLVQGLRNRSVARHSTCPALDAGRRAGWSA